MTDDDAGWRLYSPEEWVRLGLSFPLPRPAKAEPEFEARCRRALGVVQRDLDATGLGEHRMHPKNLRADGVSVEMYAALPNGDAWGGGGGVGGMTPDMDDATLLWHAAASVSDTLLEVLRIAWPPCPVHAGPPMAPPNLNEARDGLIDGNIWWWCRKEGGHAVAPVGQLSSAAG